MGNERQSEKALPLRTASRYHEAQNAHRDRRWTYGFEVEPRALIWGQNGAGKAVPRTHIAPEGHPARFGQDPRKMQCRESRKEASGHLQDQRRSSRYPQWRKAYPRTRSELAGSGRWLVPCRKKTGRIFNREMKNEGVRNEGELASSGNWRNRNSSRKWGKASEKGRNQEVATPQ